MVFISQEFQKSLGSKQPIYDNVNRAGRSVKERSPEEDHQVIQDKLHDLKEKWNSVCGKSVDRFVFNPFLPNRLFYLHSSDWSISNKRDVWSFLL